MSIPMTPLRTVNQRRSLTSRLIGGVIYPLWTKRDHPSYQRFAREFDRTQFLSADALRQRKFELLRTQLIHAFRNVPYYRHKMQKAGITPLDICSSEDLSQLQILTKQDIQNAKELLVAQNVPVNERVPNQTGGSTGSPLQFWVDRERFDSRRASTDRHNAWAGLYPGDWYAHLWGSRFDVGTETRPKLTWRNRLLYREITLNTSLISEEDLREYVLLLRRLRPRVMLAYAQSAVMFAEYCRDNRINDIHFDSIITAAEVLLPEQQARIEEQFRARVFNRYGCREVSIIASECSYHTGLHINSDALIIEIEPVEGLPRGTGRVLVTDLLNRGMPLIRYEIGDIATWVEGSPCACGRSLPRLRSIEGRITDFLITSDGRRISGISLALLAGDMPEVRQMQFVQESLQNITLHVVPGTGYGEAAEQELRKRLYPYLRGLSDVTVKTVSSIPTEPSGKFRYVKTAASFSNAVPAEKGVAENVLVS
jgi:phenylacetate-CoA ligase